MKSTKFRATPEIGKYRIPFELEERALTDWLALLALEQSYFSCKELFCVLQTLPKTAVTPERHLVFLEKIGAHLDELVAYLEQKYLYESLPLSNEPQACIDIVAFAYAVLAQNYAALGSLPAVENAGKKYQVLHLALRAASKALLSMAQGYMQPYEGFWRFCYSLYAAAEQTGSPADAAGDDAIGDNPIAAVFKLIVIFAGIDTNQFSPREMKTAFNILERYARFAVLDKACDAVETQKILAIDLASDEGVRTIAKTGKAGVSDHCYVSVFPVAKQLYLLLRQASIPDKAIAANRFLCFRLMKILSLPQKRKFSRINEQRQGLAIIGFDNIRNFLRKKNRVKSCTPAKPDLRIAGAWRAPDLNYPESDEWLEAMMDMTFTDALKFDKAAKTGISVSLSKKTAKLSAENAAAGDAVPLGEFEIINSSAQGLHAAWQAADLKVKVGDIFAIPSKTDDKVHLGLIRRINRLAAENVRLSIELIGCDCELVQLSREGHPSEVILLPGLEVLKQRDSIISRPDEVQANEKLSFFHKNKNRICQVQRLINSTDSISQREVVYIADQAS